MLGDELRSFLCRAAVVALPLAAPLPAVAAEDSAPMTIVADLSSQRLTIYRGLDVVLRSPISSGARGHRTPTGVFSIIQKNRHHFSNIYSGAPMPFMQRITWSGIALHAGHLPGYPASHGCIRLPYGVAGQMFKMTAMNTRVVVTYGSPGPRGIGLPAQFDPLPPGEVPLPPLPHPAPTAGDVRTVPAEKPLLQPVRYIQSLVGVPDAAAAETRDWPRTRAGVAARDTARIEQLADTRQRAADLQDEIQARVEEAGRVLAAARAQLNAVKAAQRKALAEHAAAQRAGDRARSLLRQMLERALASSAGIDQGIDETSLLARREVQLEAQIADHDAELAIARSQLEEIRPHASRADSAYRRALRNWTEVAADLNAAKESLVAATAALAKAEQLRALADKPVSVLISRQTGRIYIRQGWQPVHEEPIEILESDRPIGTHVFTAIGSPEDARLAWQVISVPDGKGGANTPGEALRRFRLPDAARTLIEERVKVGSSLIISDRGPSHETGKGTDFVLLTR